MRDDCIKGRKKKARFECLVKRYASEALSILGSAQREERKTVDMAPDFYRQFHCMVLANRSAVLRILGVDEVEMQSGTVFGARGVWKRGSWK